MITENDIVGIWLLVDRGSRGENEALLAKRYGDKQEGVLIISPDGWFSANIGWADRPPLPGNPAWHTDAPDAARLKAFDTFISYGGTWRIEHDQMINTVHFALNPGWVGGEQVRGLKLLPGGGLELTVTRRWPSGEEASGWVTWRRASPSNVMP